MGIMVAWLICKNRLNAAKEKESLLLPAFSLSPFFKKGETCERLFFSEHSTNLSSHRTDNIHPATPIPSGIRKSA